MAKGKKILLLDDDRNHLGELSRYLVSEGYVPLAAQDVEQAEEFLQEGPVLAIVDLFLAGDRGAELSGEFIENHLEPNGIPYGRMSSAPDMVPAHQRGAWVLHKREFWDEPDCLFPYLIQVLGNS